MKLTNATSTLTVMRDYKNVIIFDGFGNFLNTGYSSSELAVRAYNRVSDIVANNDDATFIDAVMAL